MVERLGLARPLGTLFVIAGLVALAACGPPKTPTGGAPTGGAPTGGAPSGQAAAPSAGGSSTLTGAGATFPAVLYSKWFNEYERTTSVKVNYQSIGSGGGIKSIADQTVDFGATDAPMTEEQQKEAKGGAVLHVPMALGAVVVTYNLPSFNTALKLTPDSLTAIYLGEITKWNDPKLVMDNPGLGAVDRNIVVAHRSDGSGTTAIFTDYLSTVSPAWKQRVGNATSVNWPVGIGGKGNEGVAGEVKQNQYAIGYVELIYAVQNKLGVAEIKNKAGNFVEPTVATTTAAAAGIVDIIPDDMRVSIVDPPGADAYPLAGLTWQLVYKDVSNRAKATTLAQLLWWEIHEGQKYSADLGYAPLPDGIVRKAETQIRSITSGGQPAFSGS